MTIGNRPPTVRADGRGPNDLRPVTFTLGVQKWAEGSCRIRVGDTEVLCAATIVDRVPPHLRGKGTGWVTAEYSMLPRATAERTDRESVKGRIGGRTHEIQRLDRAVAARRRGPRPARRADDHRRLRCAAGRRRDPHRVDHRRLRRPRGGAHHRTAWSVTWWPRSRPSRSGLVNGLPYLDLDYSEDSRADVDLNVVGTDAGAYIELQGTAEGKPFDRAAANGLLDLADGGLARLFEAQAAVLATVRR